MRERRSRGANAQPRIRASRALNEPVDRQLHKATINRPILPPRNGIDDETSLNLHWKQLPMLATAPNRELAYTKCERRKVHCNIKRRDLIPKTCISFRRRFRHPA